MGFKEFIPSLPPYNPTPPPDAIQEVADLVRIDNSYGGYHTLDNAYMYQYYLINTGQRGYLYAAVETNYDVQAFFSVNGLPPDNIEYTRLGAHELKYYYDGVLLATPPALVTGDTLYGGYLIHFL